MANTDMTIRHRLIINKIRRGTCTLKDISKHLENESKIYGYDLTVSSRTLKRDMDAIASTYNIEIVCNKSDNTYYIESDQNDYEGERILEALDVFNALNISDNLKEYIQFDKRAVGGTEYLQELLSAIKTKKQVSFLYQKYWDDKPLERTVAPYALKEFANRWYLLGHEIGDTVFKTFALDRFQSLKTSRFKYNRNKYFDLNDFFKDAFGIITPKGLEAEEIILSFVPHQGKYIKSLPLHNSQQIIADNDDELRISLKILPSFDFKKEILSYGALVKVIKPESLKKEIQEEHIKAAQY
ncbi:helix-turn-helix transcriptional regulator [Marinifilum sp. RC60d5]|uniref:helix-turn-helix transcriptional regulator n=1 Tax=Marinifilum sp. RC60d5 TaxID=3458414 RepID=UPI0040364A19